MGRPLLALGAVVGGALSVLSAVPAAAASSASGSSSTHGPGLSVISQTPWVGPGQSMQLRLGVNGEASSLSLTMTLYQHLTSRSAFSLTEAGTSVGQVVDSATVDVSSLPPDPAGGVDVTIPVSSGDAPASGTGQLNPRLECAADSCGGVYPLRLQLAATGGGRTQLFTYLVYANPPADTQRLRVSWVLPVALPASALTGTTSGPSSAQADHLGQLLAAVDDHSAVPVTFAPEPAALTAMAASPRAKTRGVVSMLQSLSASPGRQVLGGPFVPVGAAGLVDTGLSGELTNQVRRGSQVLASLRAGSDTWMAGGPFDSSTLSALSGLGIRRLVLSSSDVQGGSSPLTSSQPFTATSHGQSFTAVMADSGLQSDVTSTGSGTALAGYRMLADLALIYYEQPNRSTPRGVLATAGPAAQVDPATVDVVLGALETDPLVAPVTAGDLFTEVPLSSGTPRRLQPPTGPSTLPARQIRSARAQLSAFSSSVDSAGAATARALDDRLLVAEDDELHPSQQSRQVTTATTGLSQQLSSLSIRADTVRLTSTAARVPITVLKQSHYGVTARLTVTGDKVEFPSSSGQSPGSVCRTVKVHRSAGKSTFSCLAVIGHATNAVYVDMRARVSGDFRLTVTLVSPTGGLVLASSHVTVRSMSSSVVAVVLSAVAVAVLLLWWGRTLWRGHPAPSRGAHARRRRPMGRRQR